MVLREFSLTALFVVGALLFSSRAEARPPRPVFELSEHEGRELGPRPGVPGPPPFVAQLTVYADGTWIAGEQRGTLAPAARAEILRAIARTRIGMERRRIAICTGLPNSVMRLRTQRGVVTWLTPCSRPPNQATLALIEQVRSQTSGASLAPVETPEAVPAPSSEVLVSYGHNSMDDPMGGDHFVVYADGRTEGLGDGARISPEGMRELEQLVRTTVLGPAPRESRHECAARLTGEASIEVRGRGSHRWSTPCGQPHPSIGTLMQRVRALAGAR